MSNTRLQRFIESFPATKERLPFLHITNGYNFDRIQLGDVLKTSHCRVFEQDLLYFFYGRPSYKMQSTHNERLAFDWPVIFLFDYKLIHRQISSLYPFDSGAFASGRYKHFFDKNSSLLDYEIRKGRNNVRRIVSAFYQNNYEYFCGASRKNVMLPVNEFEAAGVYELARVPNRPDEAHALRYDERSSSIEAISKQPLNLKNNIEYLILPKKFLDVPHWSSSINRWKPKNIRTYSIIQNTSPDSFAGMIYRIVEEIIFGV